MKKSTAEPSSSTPSTAKNFFQTFTITFYLMLVTIGGHYYNLY
jgi:hypothetical protein